MGKLTENMMFDQKKKAAVAPTALWKNRRENYFSLASIYFWVET